MKAAHFLTYLVCLLLQVYNASAQNIGIGTNNPAARLDILKPGGDTPTLSIRGSQYISHFNWGANEDTYIRGGKPGSNVILNDQDAGPVGIGTALGVFPLTFSNLLGDKISLWGSSGAHYGFGIQSGQLQIHTDLSASDILFGYGSSTLFTENMRIKGTGFVGIGTYDPTFKLDIADRMRIRSGGGFSTAGLYLNNNNNTASPAFIGMDDDTHVGFWGSGIGWRFSMNTQTGALKINGSEGASGQVITSTGAGPAIWQSPTKTAYDLTTMVTQSSSLTMAQYNAETAIPGLTYTFSLSTTTKIILNLNLNVTTVGCSFCGTSTIYALIKLDGGFGATTYGYVENGRQVNFPASAMLTVGPGTHTISVNTFIGGPDVIFNAVESFSGRMVFQMIPG